MRKSFETPIEHNSPGMNDETYRRRLIDSGVLCDRLDGLAAHQLDCVGNIVRVYRTTEREQNPSAWAIEQAHAAHESEKCGFCDPSGASPYAFAVAIWRHPIVASLLLAGLAAYFTALMIAYR